MRESCTRVKHLTKWTRMSSAEVVTDGGTQNLKVDVGPSASTLFTLCEEMIREGGDWHSLAAPPMPSVFRV
eukprot:5478558-Amphidinium_carterae.1